MTTRTQDEILARYRDAYRGGDFFGFRREVLAESMEGDTLRAAGFNVDDKLAAQAPVTPPANLPSAAVDYLKFAVGKIVDHRGISASRSVEKLTEYAWLLGRDDVVEAMAAADYPQYGAPQVRAFAEGMGWPFLDLADGPGEREELERMSLGRLCDDECVSGCGR